MSNTFPNLVAEELRRARRIHEAPHSSAHESYAVLLEELEEFWEECRKKRRLRDKESMLSELVQIGAMAQRAAEDLELIDPMEAP